MDTQKAQKLGSLLANSILPDEVRGAIIENIAIIPMPLIDKLIATLETEGVYMKNAVAEIEDFFKDQNIAWDALAERQAKEADRIVAEEVLRVELEMLAETHNQNTNS